jgi:(R,R)-butanediol dehydrogenase/meso-butanediol dehydrogenase/diacetyl reductase
MKAAVLHGPRDVRVSEVPDAPAPRAAEVRVRLIAAGICGTDIHEYLHAPVFAPLFDTHPASGHKGPMIIGHEFLGVIVEVGAGVTDFLPGDRVVAGAGQWCGTCHYCLAGRTNLCESYYTYGLNHDGGMAEYVTVPAQMLAAVPSHVTDRNAVLAQPVAVAVHAVSRSQARSGDVVAVIGAGAIGALVVAALREVGVAPTVFDIDPGRLGTAIALGAGEVVCLDAGRGDSDPGLAERRRSFDIAFDTSGIATSLNTAILLTRRGGRTMAVGLPGHLVSVDSHDAVVREVDICSSSGHVCGTDLPAAVELLSRRDISKHIVGEVVDLDRVVDGLERLAARSATGKTIVRISGAALR